MSLSKKNSIVSLKTEFEELHQSILALENSLQEVLDEDKTILSQAERNKRKTALQSLQDNLKRQITILEEKQKPLAFDDRLLPELSLLKPKEKAVITTLVEHATYVFKSVNQDIEKVRAWQNNALAKKAGILQIFRLSSLRRMLRDITQADKVLAFDADRLFKQIQRFVVLDYAFKPTHQKAALSNLAYKSLIKALEDAEYQEKLRSKMRSLHQKIEYLQVEKQRLTLGINERDFENMENSEFSKIDEDVLLTYKSYCADEMEVLAGLGVMHKNISALRESMLLPEDGEYAAKMVAPKVTRPLVDLSKKIQKTLSRSPS